MQLKPIRTGNFALAGMTLILAACGSGGNDNVAAAPEIRVLSTRADFVTGGDALVEVAFPAGISTSGATVFVGNRDVSSSFTANANGRLTGLVTGLANGANTIIASSPLTKQASLTVTNAPIGGPVISGPQIQPWVCATPAPQAEAGTTPSSNGSGLPTAATDAQCNIATDVKYFYKTTTAGCAQVLPDPTTGAAPANACFKPYNPAAAAPADLATTTTDAGVRVPYIVRRERGTLNRGIYDIAVLADPTKPWTATAPQNTWNGKVLYQFGSSTGQPRKQFRPQGSWANDLALGRGVMVAQNSLSDSQYNSNRVLMSETVMMMKEKIQENFGLIKFTMGTGCSGGSINQLTASTIMPGLLDGIMPSCTYPDSETTTMEVQDCVLLVELYQKPEWAALMASAGYTQEQINAKKAAINGHVDQTACHGWNNLFGNNSKPGNFFARAVTNNVTGAITQATTSTNNCGLPASVVYDPVTNPSGPRCGAYDSAVSIFGKNADGRARDTRDNVGVQYGLRAFTTGTITAEEFVTLNERIGGFNRDSVPSATRTTADTEALEIAYKAGLVTSGKQLAKTAIIDLRGWDDSLLVPLATGAAGQAAGLTGIHHVWRSFSLRDRMDRDNGNHDNHALWRFGRTGFVPSAAISTEAFVTMDKWLTTLKADTRNLSIEQKVISSKPAEAADFCYLSTDTTQTTKVTDRALCDADPFLRPSASPRQVAGSPRTEDVLKCQLKPINVAEYAPQTLSASQLARLQAVFPTGVCDWSKPGVGQQTPTSPLNFAAGPGGQPFAAAPVSIAR